MKPFFTRHEFNQTYAGPSFYRNILNFPAVIYSSIKTVKNLFNKHIPTRDKTIRTPAPNSMALRLPILVTAMVCTFSVRVVEPVPVPHRPAKTLQKPSRPIARLTTPGVGGLDATNNDEAWYDPTYKDFGKQ